MIDLKGSITKEELEKYKKVKNPPEYMEGFDKEEHSDRKIWFEDKKMRNFIE